VSEPQASHAPATNRPWAIIAGGGTGGHVTPAIAIGRALVDRGHDPSTIHFVGSRRGIEARLVPAAGFSVTLLPGRGIQRRLTVENVGALTGLARALVSAVWLVGRRRPHVVVSVGGYASAPCAIAAVVFRVPLVLAEQNAHPGAAHRLVARFARACAVTFDGTPLPHAVVTGNPVRGEILAIDRSPRSRDDARRALDLPPDRAVVLAFGGSLGARRINTAVAGLADAWAARSDVAIRHVVGSRDWAEVSRTIPPSGDLVYQRVEFEDRMDVALTAADVAVCRAGASTIAELTVAGVPAIYVPFPAATGDHQTANARAVADAGGGVLVPDADLTTERLADELDALVGDADRLAAMSAAARALGRPDAADRVAALVEEHARP
jgi:UDP-N-acetylglucosamine--N-acetylmuramyl-(pentapeptide) pyrophosphoryl-undecaprenol N-acetylglucosamine transferase